MIRVAIKMLVGDRLKYLGLVVGLAFAALLISQQASILVGLAWQTGSFIRDTSQADLWVMDDQVRFSQDSLPINDSVLQRTRGVSGVKWAVPMYQGFLKVRLPDGTRMVAILVGIDDATLIGAPPQMAQGSLEDLRRDKAVFLNEDELAAKFTMKRGGERALRVGDRFSINDREVEVAGTFRASKSFFWEPVIYTTYTRALAIAPPERRLLNYVLVKAEPGVDVAALAQEITRTTGFAALTSAQFEQKTVDYILKETGILVNFGMAVGLGFVVGLLIAGQMLYAFTLDNLRHFGALKAMGASDWTLISMMLAQVLVVGAMGYGVGIGCGAFLGTLVAEAGLAFKMPWWIPVACAVSILAICLVAGALSMIRVLRLEPAVVFKA